MARVREGETHLLSELFERHGERLFRYCWRMNQQQQLSEDLVQETFCRMLRFRAGFRDGHSFQAWMYSIVRNLQMDHWRKGRFEAGWDDGIDHPAPAAPAIEREQEKERLARALELLPVAKREIIVMARYEGLKHEEIAQILGCEAGAARVRLHRALESLRDVYRELEQGRKA